jgi:hypothetical protein
MSLDDIARMVKILKPVLKDKEKARELLARYWSNKFAVVWTRMDIHRAANERGLALSKKEAQRLLDDLKVHCDRQYGFKWTDLWDLIDDSWFGRKMTKQETKGFVNTTKPVVAKATRSR